MRSTLTHRLSFCIPDQEALERTRVTIQWIDWGLERSLITSTSTNDRRRSRFRRSAVASAAWTGTRSSKLIEQHLDAALSRACWSMNRGSDDVSQLRCDVREELWFR